MYLVQGLGHSKSSVNVRVTDHVNTPLNRSQPINSTVITAEEKRLRPRKKGGFTRPLHSLPEGCVFFDKTQFCPEPRISLPIALTSHSDELFCTIQGPPHTLLKEPHPSQISLGRQRMERRAGALDREAILRGRAQMLSARGLLPNVGTLQTTP